MSIMTADKILHQIDRLPKREQRRLEKLLDERFEAEWRTETRKARAAIKKAGITQADIEKAIARRRYSK
jgi:hypothetical protein